MAVLKSSPGCVMLAFIAPYFASVNPADLIAFSGFLCNQAGKSV
ncbi:hypothetical protein [Citrobacter pasteurii]|nr:hypothetical protein SF123566_2186 [Shigella flexneri 1235-66]CEJ64178.1 hypothetical protein [Citrobacter pasteurii]